MPRLPAIAALYAALEIALIAARVAPARDGGRYIRQALRFDSEPWLEVIRSSPDHPGYPLLLHGTFVLARGAGLESPRELAVAAQCASAACGLALVALAFFAARRLWGSLPATAGLAAFVLLPRPANHLSDVLSDPLHAALWVGSAALVVRGLEMRRLSPFLTAGLVAGLAYWARIDALTLPLSVAGAAAVLPFLPHASRWPARRAAGAAALHIAGFAAVLAAFVAVKGELSGEGVADTIVGDLYPAAPAAGPGARAPLATAGMGGALVEVAGAVGQEVQWLHLGYLVVAVIACSRLRRLTAGGLFVLVASAVYLGVLVFVRERAGYVAGRYALPLLALLVPFGMWGMVRAGLPIRRPGKVSSKRTRSRRSLPSLPRLLAGAAVALSVAVSLPSFLGHRPHESFHGVLRAGEWVRDHAPGGGPVLDPYYFPTFLAGIPERAILDPAAGAETRPFHAIAQDRDLPQLPGLRSLIESGRAKEAASFPRTPGGDRMDVRVYAVSAP